MPQSKRTRAFCGITYLHKNSLEIVQLCNANAIRSVAFILHDRDINDDGTPKEPHYHFILRTYNAKTPTAIESWFRSLGEENTFVQCCTDILSYSVYMTHQNEPNKVKYPQTDIFGTNTEDIIKQEEAKDNALEILDDINRNTPLRVMAKKYGRDFIYHRDQYHEYAYLMEQQELASNAKVNRDVAERIKKIYSEVYEDE